MRRKPNDLEIAALAVLHHWHGNRRNFNRAEPAHLKLIRAALEKRGRMPYQLARDHFDDDVLVREAVQSVSR